MSWKCLIVDDEPPAQRIIERFIADIPSLTVIAKCKNAIEANEILLKKEVDIMFLDINMPKISGLNFLRTLTKPPTVIITTAYREFALEGYELDVIDYLKKPFSFERFFKAVNKAIDSLSPSIVSPLPNDNQISEPKQQFIFVKEDKISYKVDIDEIMYIESVGDYNKIYTEKKVYLTYQTLKKLQELLPSNHFPRIHKSYIISFNKIENITGNHVKIKGEIIPIGQSYRKEFFKQVERYQ